MSYNRKLKRERDESDKEEQEEEKEEEEEGDDGGGAALSSGPVPQDGGAHGISPRPHVSSTPHRRRALLGQKGRKGARQQRPTRTFSPDPHRSSISHAESGGDVSDHTRGK